MCSKYTLVFLMVMGLVAFAFADAPCDGNPYEESHCEDHKGQFVLNSDNECVENIHVAHDGIEGVQCIYPGYAFDTLDECKEKCKDAIKFIP